MRSLKGLLIALLSLLLLCPAWAEPEKVTVGIYLDKLTGLELKTNSFYVDFYLWFRWKNDRLKPHETWELTNGRVINKPTLVLKKVGDELYAVGRVQAQITQFWEMKSYPLDSQNLTIQLEDSLSEDRVLVYAPDRANTARDPLMAFPGWSIVGESVEVALHKYVTNYGDPSLKAGVGSEYARFVYTLQVARPSFSRFIKVFFPLLIATFVSWLAFWIRPKDLPPRVSICVGSLFAAAAASLSINSSLPDTSVTTMSDRLIVVCLSQIFISCLVTVVSMTLFAKGREQAYLRLDSLCAYLFPAGFLVLLWFYVL